MHADEPQMRFAEHTLSFEGRDYAFFRVHDVQDADKLPVSLKILIENVLRCTPDPAEARTAAEAIVEAGLQGTTGPEIEFMPTRVLFQDFTGVPVFVDFAAARDAARARGADPSCVNPQIPCTLVIDHSVAADVVSCDDAARENARIEASRNAERFAFLKWSQASFQNVTIVPPGQGICHQLNIERFCRVAMEGPAASGQATLAFDTLVGTDSHTTTANGVGVLGWGVGGIEAEAAALGQPISMLIPKVVGVHLSGELTSPVSAMDVALIFAERLRAHGVVGALVECFGEGVSKLSATQRATISNMCPEYGSTAVLFPADASVIDQLALMGRTPAEISLAELYLAAQGLLDVRSDHTPIYADVIDIDLSSIQLSLAGPSRPHNRVTIADLKGRFEETLALHKGECHSTFPVEFDGARFELSHGALALAAITSCTTATDPAMMIAAGLTAKRALELGCKPLPWVKKVFAPGSHATTDLLSHAHLLDPLAQLGFAVCGWGCMSCIGNSGSLFEPMHAIASECELTSVLSGNRNFDGRISPDVAQNYLAAPALVLAYSLAGRMNINLAEEAICEGSAGDVYLSDILPSDEQVAEILRSVLVANLYEHASETLMQGDENWQALPAHKSVTFAWDPRSSYVRRPSYFEDAQQRDVFQLKEARALALLPDFVTTDHISPAGSIAPNSPAADYLRDFGIPESEFNSYGSRRGNHELMARGTFANVKLDNSLADGRQGGWTYDHWSGEIVPIYDAAVSAARHDTALVVLAGKMYGSGSSRDWAAKGPALLGVRAVLAESFERIHRSNLIGMGILPLQFKEGESAETRGLTGHETFSLDPIDLCQFQAAGLCAHMHAYVQGANTIDFDLTVRIDTPTELAYVRAGGILPFVLDSLLNKDSKRDLQTGADIKEYA